MQLTRLRVFHFRNLAQEEIFLAPGVNLLSGANAQGKTNLLEAIYLLGFGKSFRTTQPRDCVMHGESECRVDGEVATGCLVQALGVEISGRGKRLLAHGKAVPIEEFIGKLHLLAFTSEHLQIVRGGPAQRRAFLDRAMVTLYPAHIRLLASYGRALKQRNRLLADARGVAPDKHLLESWEERLVHDGARIAANRMSYVEKMKEALPSGLFGPESLKIRYLSHARVESGAVEDMEEALRSKLILAREADLGSGHTSVGPHRDELKLFVNSKSLADFGSAGQQRSALVSLYFAQMEIHCLAQGFYPLLLVDDAEAELDEGRLASFLTYLSQRTQTILTTAKSELLPAMPAGICRFSVREGRIEAL